MRTKVLRKKKLDVFPPELKVKKNLVVTRIRRDVRNLPNYIERRASPSPISSAINAYPTCCLINRR